MSRPYYVKFETPKDTVNAIYEALRIAKQSGKVRKGTNETTKAIERGISRLVIVAEDVEPPEVVAHLPILCDERNATYVFVPSKKQLGESMGIDVGSAAATIIDAGEAQNILDICSRHGSPLKIETLDGVKIWIDEETWIMVRPSGTEPIIRIYAESNDYSLLNSKISEYNRLLLSVLKDSS